MDMGSRTRGGHGRGPRAPGGIARHWLDLRGTGRRRGEAPQANFEEAMRQQVYGVPTLAIGDELFWGSDAHAFAMDYLEHPEMFAEGEMARLGALPIGLSRV